MGTGRELEEGINGMVVDRDGQKSLIVTGISRSLTETQWMGILYQSGRR